MEKKIYDSYTQAKDSISLLKFSAHIKVGFLKKNTKERDGKKSIFYQMDIE